MNETVRNIVKGVMVVIVVAIGASAVNQIEKCTNAKRKVEKAEKIATGIEVKIEDTTWKVRTYQTANGRCYKVHTANNRAFTIPCE